MNKDFAAFQQRQRARLERAERERDQRKSQHAGQNIAHPVVLAIHVTRNAGVVA